MARINVSQLVTYWSILRLLNLLCYPSTHIIRAPALHCLEHKRACSEMCHRLSFLTASPVIAEMKMTHMYIFGTKAGHVHYSATPTDTIVYYQLPYNSSRAPILQRYIVSRTTRLPRCHSKMHDFSNLASIRSISFVARA